MSHMRDRGVAAAWAEYLTAAREAAGLSKVGLARAAKVGRATVFRWEGGDSRPERAEIVARVARVLGVDLDEALAAAGLRPTSEPPTHPARPPHEIDSEIDLIREAKIPVLNKEELILYWSERRRLEDADEEAAHEAKKKARVAELQMLLQALERAGTGWGTG